jgi:hypothetical protein
MTKPSSVGRAVLLVVVAATTTTDIWLLEWTIR